MKKVFISIAAMGLSLCSAGAVAQSDLAGSLNTFAFNLYNQIKVQNQNNVFSPYSLSSLLSILANGAAGTTKAQFLKVLNLEVSDIAAANNLAEQLTGDSKNFLIANALWGDKSFTFEKSFTDLVSHYRVNHFYTVDFKHAPQTAVKTINDWVNSNTKGYIKDILSIDAVTPQTQLILTNAIYFKGVWDLPFEKSLTGPKEFTLEDGSKANVPMMQRESEFLYTENRFLQVLQLNYSDSSLALMILLPSQHYTPGHVQQLIHSKDFADLTKGMQKRRVRVNLPKFKIESTYQALAKGLKSIGLTDAFTKADFSRLSPQPLAITDVIQKALIQVDEEGTVAAAATSVMVATAVYHPPVPPMIFNANHPFAFILYDTKTKLILFMGQVVDPR